MKEIVVIRLSSLGDVAMLVPVFLSFHKSYPEVKIRLVTRERFAPIFSDLHFVRIEAIDSGKSTISLGKLIHFGIQLSRTKPEIVLDLHDVLRTMVLRSFCRLFGSKIAEIDKGRAEKNEIISPNGDKTKRLKTTFQRYTDVFEKAGFSFELAPHFLKKSVEKSSKKRIGISPFAKHFSKEYSFDKMQTLLEKLASHSDFELIIFGNGEREERISQEMSLGISNVNINIGKMSFAKELKLISSLDLMISMDSGNGHLAANYGIPVLTLWGTTHPKIGFAPYLQPLSNSLFPDEKLYPNLPVSVFGKCDDIDYLRAIDSIVTNDIYKLASSILEQ
jgi:ADP-heptose:LPS heptosyltransferase